MQSCIGVTQFCVSSCNHDEHSWTPRCSCHICGSDQCWLWLQAVQPSPVSTVWTSQRVSEVLPREPPDQVLVQLRLLSGWLQLQQMRL